MTHVVIVRHVVIVIFFIGRQRSSPWLTLIHLVADVVRVFLETFIVDLCPVEMTSVMIMMSSESIFHVIGSMVLRRFDFVTEVGPMMLIMIVEPFVANMDHLERIVGGKLILVVLSTIDGVMCLSNELSVLVI